MEISELYDLFLKAPHVTIDSRNCPPNSIFFALKGPNFNGNEYAKKAIENGCRYAIVDEEEFEDTANNIFLVDNSLSSLQDLAHYHRTKFKIPVIAITGTNGKTTTKELVASVLSEVYNVLHTKGNFNNHIGVPLTLLQMGKEHEIAVIEMGASHVGEIEALCKIADPTFGLITNLGYAHLEGFGSFENIIKTKTELYEYIRHRKDGKIFIDHHNAILKEKANGITEIEYGNEDRLFVVGKLVSCNPFLTFSWKFTQNLHTVETHLIGEYNLPNALAAIAIGKYFGIKSTLISKAISQYVPTNNRSQLIETAKNKVIVDAYNANPTSMKAALANLMNVKDKSITVILGDMRELGSESEDEHKKIISFIKDLNLFDRVFLVGENFKKQANGYNSFDNVSELNTYLQQHPIENQHILIKGSRGVELEKCLGYL